MAIISNIVASLRADTSRFDRPIKKSRGTLKSFTSDISRNQRHMLNYAKSAVGFYAVQRAIRSVTSAAMTQEKAQMSLAAALSTTGDATRDNLKDLMKYASQMQKQTIFGDEDIAAQMAYAKNLGVVTGKLKDAATAAIGLAAKYNLDLKTSMMLVGRASQGQTQMLTRYGIALSETLSPQEKFDELLKIGAKSFSLATAQAGTTEGKLTQMKNTFGDVAEVLGGALLPTITTFASTLASMDVATLTANLETVVNVVKNIGVAIGGLYILKTIRTLAYSTAQAMAALWGVMSAPAVAVIGAIAGIGVGIYTLRTAWKNNINGMRDMLVDWGKTITSMWNAVFPVFAKAYTWIRDGWNDMWSGMVKKMANYVKDSLSMMSGFASAAKAIMDLDFANIGNRWAEGFTKSWSNLDDIEKKMTSTGQEAVKSFKVMMGAISEINDNVFVPTFSELWKANLNQAQSDLDRFIVWLDQKAPALTKLFKPIRLTSPTSDENLDAQIAKIKNLQGAIGNLYGTDGASEMGEVASNTAVDIEATMARMYGQITKMSESAYQAKLKLLDKEYESHRKNNIDILANDAWYAEQKAKLDIERFKSSNKAADGFKAASMQMDREALNWSERTYEIAMSTRDIMRSGLMDMARDWSDWGESVKRILEEVYWKAVETAFITPAADKMASAFSMGASALMGGFSGNGGANYTGGNTPGVGAKPSAVKHGYGFASGGIANRASIFGESGPEAAVPLPDGRTIPVTLNGGGMGDIQVQVYHVGDGRGNTSTEQSSMNGQQVVSIFMHDSSHGGQTARQIKQLARRAN